MVRDRLSEFQVIFKITNLPKNFCLKIYKFLSNLIPHFIIAPKFGGR